jgi:Family of unknown function (DUF6263)
MYLLFISYFVCKYTQVMKKNFFLTAAIAMTIAMPVIQSCKSSKSSSTKLLKFNLQKGNGYDYEMVWDMNTKVMGQESKISIDGLYSMNIIDDDGHVKSVATIYKNIKMNMQIMGKTIDMDSNNKPTQDTAGNDNEKNPINMMNKVISGITGKSFIVKVDEEGKVLEVTGFDKIVSDMIDSIGGDKDTKTRVMASMKDQFNNQTIKDQFAQIFTIFPNKEIKVGDSWEKSFTTGGKMPAKYTTNYTVKEIEGDHVSMTTNTTIGSDSGDLEMKGNQTGNIVVDSKTGLMINAEFNQDIEAKMQGMTINLTGKGRIKGKAN